MIQCKQCGNILVAGQHTCEVCGVWNDNQTVATPPRRQQHFVNPQEQGVYRGSVYNAQNASINAPNSLGYSFPFGGQTGGYRDVQTAKNANNSSPYFREYDAQRVMCRQEVITQQVINTDRRYKIQVGGIIVASVLFVVAGTIMWLNVYGFV